MERGLKTVRFFDTAINKIVSIFLIIIMLIGGYAVWDTYMVYVKADISRNLSKYKPTDSNPSLSELQQINPDVCAWITIYDTKIDFPVLYCNNNTKYLNCDIYGQYTLGGSVFLDYRNDRFFGDYYSILYGHHMDGGAMFGDVKNFSDEGYFAAHKKGEIFLENEVCDLEVIAHVACDAYDPYLFETLHVTQGDKNELNKYIRQKSDVFDDDKLTTENNLIAFTTCESATTNGRSIIIAKIIKR